MKEIRVTSQEQLDKISVVSKEECVIVESSQELTLKSTISVYGVLEIYTKVSMSMARHVDARENSSVLARENCHVLARENCHVVARENCHVDARENSSVVARENSSVELSIGCSLGVNVKLFGFSVCWKPFGNKFDIKIKSKNAFIQIFKDTGFFDREGVEVIKGKVVLYKKVSKDFKTQENTERETIWTIGSTLEHPSWNPSQGECGVGKYHACSTAYFCDEFRNNVDDVYIAIEIAKKDLFEWKGGKYPHKIAFRKGKVLYQCTRFGKKI